MSQWLPKALILLLGPVYAICLFAPAFGQVHDDAVYLVVSRALANGAGYVVDSLPETVAQTKYPFLYPAILTIFWKATNSLTAVAFLSKLLSVLSAVGWIVVLRRLARRQLASAAAADWVVFIGVSVPWAVFLSTSILPDTLFALLTTWALDIIHESESPNSPPLGWKGVASVAVLASAAFLIRTTGLALLLACVFVLFRRRFYFGVAFLLVCTALCGPWLLWQASQPAPSDEVLLYYSKLSYAKGHILANYNWGQMINIVSSNALMLSTFFMGVFYKLPALMALILAAVLGYFTVTAWFRDLIGKVGVLSVWALLYTGILAVWVWPPYRYMLPLVPILLLFNAQGIMNIRSTPGRIRILYASLMIYACAVVITHSVNAFRTLQFQTTIIGWGDAEKWSNHLELAAWIRSSTPANAVVAAGLDPALHLMTGRKTIRLSRYMPYEVAYGPESETAPVCSPDAVREHLRKHHVTHVLMTPLRSKSDDRHFWKAFNTIQQTSPGTFRLVKDLPDEGFAIYEVNPVEL